ncbi:TPA: DUF1642 domain-containing protein [Streptococcus suis]
MKTNDFYEVDGCMDFIPVAIEGTYDDGVIVAVSNAKRNCKLVVEEVYRFLKVHEPQKVIVPKFVAEWIEYCKSNKLTLLGAFDPVSEHGIGLANTFTGEVRKGVDWAQRNQDTFARAWIDGYEIEKEQLYTVEIPNNGGTLVLARVHQSIKLVDGNKRFPGKFTKELIENAGFYWALKWAKEVK